VTIGVAPPNAQTISGFAPPFTGESASPEGAADFALELLDAVSLEITTDDGCSGEGEDPEEGSHSGEKLTPDFSSALAFVIPLPVPAPPQPLEFHLNLDCPLESQGAAGQATVPPQVPKLVPAPLSIPGATAPAVASQAAGDLAFAIRIEAEPPAPPALEPLSEAAGKQTSGATIARNAGGVAGGAPVAPQVGPDFPAPKPAEALEPAAHAAPRAVRPVLAVEQPEQTSQQSSGQSRDGSSNPFTPTPSPTAGLKPQGADLDSTSPIAADPVAPAPAEMRETKSAGPLRDVSLQFQNAAQERVDVRLSQRAGELHVAVRTPDGELARGLGQSLPELVERLQETGFRTETWKPGHTASPTPTVSSTASSTADFQNAESGRQSGGSGQQHREQRDSQQFHRPRWVEELEGSLQGAAPQPGDRNGIVR
jgi:hypothetical protein